MYPKNKDEAEKFKIGIVRSLHDEKTRPGVMATLTNQQAPVPVRVGTVASTAVSGMLDRVKKQAGRQPHLKLLTKGIAFAVKEASKMLEITGEKVSKEDQIESARIAGDLIESGQQGGQGQQQPQQQPQQPTQQPQPGIMGGANESIR